MDSSKSPEDSSCYKLTKSKPMKEFSTEEVSSWVDEKFDENIGAKFAGEYWPSRARRVFHFELLSLSSKLFR